MIRHLALAACLALSVTSAQAMGRAPKPGNTDRAPAMPKERLAVPIMGQATDYSCGAAALLSVLTYWNAWYGHEADLYKLLETTPQNGTEPLKILEGARTFGLRAEMKTEMTISELRGALARGETVILDIQAWSDTKFALPPWKERWEDGHYVVLVAMDDKNAFVMDPSTYVGYAWLPIAELEDRWHDYEDRHGIIQRNYRLGIRISGARPLTGFPSKLTRLE